MAVIGKKEIDRRFESHPVNKEQSANIAAVTAKFKTLASWIDKNVNNPREAASALTHLEQAKFFTVAGISRPGTPGAAAAPAKSANASAGASVRVSSNVPLKADGRSKEARAAKAAAAAPAAPVKKSIRRPLSK